MCGLFSSCREWGYSSCGYGLIVVASLVAERGLVGSWVSVVAAGGLSSCGSWAWAQLLHGMWDLPESGIVPVTPALAGKILYH